MRAPGASVRAVSKDLVRTALDAVQPADIHRRGSIRQVVQGKKRSIPGVATVSKDVAGQRHV